MHNRDESRDTAEALGKGLRPLTPERISQVAADAVGWLVVKFNRGCAPGERQWTRADVIEQAVLALQTAVRRWGENR
jgi:hypothetical protein